MKIRGAVLEEIGRAKPYADSAPITISEIELDPPGPGEILVRIEAAGLCHSDLSVIDGNRVRPVPMLLGHESAGIVEQLGEGVDDVNVGDRTVTVGLPAPTALSEISPLTITAEARTIIGSYLGSAVPARDIPRYAQMWRNGTLPVEKLISSRITLDEINGAMDQLAAGQAIRQVIVFDEEAVL